MPDLLHEEPHNGLVLVADLFRLIAGAPEDLGGRVGLVLSGAGARRSGPFSPVVVACSKFNIIL